MLLRDVRSLGLSARDRNKEFSLFPLTRNRRRGQMGSPFPAGGIPGYTVPAPGTFHVVAYTGSLGSVTNNDTPAITDGIAYIQNNHILPQTDVDILWAWAGGTTLGRVRLDTPKFRQINFQYIRPISLTAAPGNNDNFDMRPRGTFRARALEEIAVEITTTGVGPAQTTCVLALGVNYVPVPQGMITNFRVTGTTTLTANKWTSVPITFETTPPQGIYAVVGGEVQSATGQAFRLTFDGQYFRPGLPCIPNLTSRIPYEMMYGQFGTWGYFSNTNLPRLEVLANAADTTQEGYLQVVKVA